MGFPSFTERFTMMFKMLFLLACYETASAKAHLRELDNNMNEANLAKFREKWEAAKEHANLLADQLRACNFTNEDLALQWDEADLLVEDAQKHYAKLQGCDDVEDIREQGFVDEL